MVHGKKDYDKDPVAQQSSVLEQVPVIDVAELIHDSTAAAAATAVDEIAQACRSWGFFQIINHDISTDLVENVWRQTRAFFTLSREQKLAVVRSRENPWGFYHNELTKNQRDKKEVFDFTRAGVDPIYGEKNRWPRGQEAFKSTMEDYFETCTRLSLKLLEAFCVGLDLPADYMRNDFATNHTGFLRLNYYPVKDPLADLDAGHQPVADLGVHHHSDAGALTLLLQDDVGGLQVHRDGFWHDIPSVPGAFVINTGDMMQVWSNDVYQAAIHRVLAMDATDRFSLPFFFNPAASCEIRPLPTVVNEHNPSRYHSIKWADFRGQRTDGDFADYGTEVQISQFRK